MEHASLPATLMLCAAALPAVCWLSLVVIVRFVPAHGRRWLLRGAVAVTLAAIIAVTAAMFWR